MEKEDTRDMFVRVSGFRKDLVVLANTNDCADFVMESWHKNGGSILQTMKKTRDKIRNLRVALLEVMVAGWLNSKSRGEASKEEATPVIRLIDSWFPPDDKPAGETR